jgi:hypothetical protein
MKSQFLLSTFREFFTQGNFFKELPVPSAAPHDAYRIDKNYIQESGRGLAGIVFSASPLALRGAS